MVLLLQAESPSSQGNTPMPWAYALNTPDVEIAFEFNVPRTVPGSDVEFVFSNPRNLYQPPDWHPENHPEMPEIVARGREPLVFACGYCHLPNGQGRPENTNLSGLSAQYIIQQMADWRNGLRRSSEPLHGPASAMQAIGATRQRKRSKRRQRIFPVSHRSNGFGWLRQTPCLKQ